MGKKDEVKRSSAEKRARFAQEYAKDLNATQAAIRAGYSPRSAPTTGSRLLSDAKVQEMIRNHHQPHLEANGITIERTLKEVARVAYFDSRKLWHADGRMKLPHELDDDTAAVIASTESIEERLRPERGEQPEQGDLLAGEPSTDAISVIRKVKTWDKIRALQQCIDILGMGKSINPAESGGLSITVFPSTARR